MSLLIDFVGLWAEGTKTRTEIVLRECIGEPPKGEKWNVEVRSFSDFCVVRVKTLQQTRRKVFLLRASSLAAVIPAWLDQYPLL